MNYREYEIEKAELVKLRDKYDDSGDRHTGDYYVEQINRLGMQE